MSTPKYKKTPEGYYVLTNDTHISRWVEEHKNLICDPHLFEWLLPKLAGVKRVWDVGAFIGDHTAAYLTIPGVEKVHAFEPNPDAFYCLDRNIGTGENRSCWNIAASDRRERLSFETAPNAGASRLKETGKAKVTAYALDDFMRDSPPPDFIKLDVEGWELRALAGMKKTLEAAHPIVFTEVNNAALEANGQSHETLFNFFFDLGYKASKIRPYTAQLTDPQYDVLFTYEK